jgi:hypothetical protein
MAPILPWGAEEDVAKVSPVAASASYLAHVRAAWRHRSIPKAPLEEQQVIVLTVPASFDEGARALTLEAARQAGLPHLRLLEEPQAAFYDWLFRHQQSLAEELASTRLLLVCDVGGGTTDLTLIQVALGRRAGADPHRRRRPPDAGRRQHGSGARPPGRAPPAGKRRHACRRRALRSWCALPRGQGAAAGRGAPESVKVTLLGGGARLIGGARTVELKPRRSPNRCLVDGFLPAVAADEPIQQRRAAIVEFGLPYPADPAITRHLAAFLKRHAQARTGHWRDDAEMRRSRCRSPDTLLFNGGVFRAEALAERLQSTLGDWRGARCACCTTTIPTSPSPAAQSPTRSSGRDMAGASVAARRAATFLVLDDGGGQKRGICLLPRGSEEGHEIRLPERTFSLRLGQPVRFHLASSVADTRYLPGEIAELDDEDFVRLPPIASVVQPHRRQHAARGARATDRRDDRGRHARTALRQPRRRRPPLAARIPVARRRRARRPISSAALPPRFADAVQSIEQIFGGRSQTVDNKEVRRLRGQLEHLLGKRDDWDMPLLRATLRRPAATRAAAAALAEHERLWLNLAGYCLRPGLGDALDDWRIEQLCAAVARASVRE